MLRRLALSIAAFLLIGLPAVAQYQSVDPADIAVGTRKYVGKDIEFGKVNCYYADVEDYRCITDASVTIFAKDITPLESKEFIEKNCDQMKKVVTQTCRLSAQFKLNAEDITNDLMSNNRRRTLINIDKVQIVLRRKR